MHIQDSAFDFCSESGAFFIFFVDWEDGADCCKYLLSAAHACIFFCIQRPQIGCVSLFRHFWTSLNFKANKNKIKKRQGHDKNYLTSLLCPLRRKRYQDSQGRTAKQGRERQCHRRCLRESHQPGDCTYSTEESFLKDFCIARFVHSTIKTTITMDLLGSIMGKMTGPPTATEKQKAERKKARELAQVTRLDSTYK